MFVAAVVASIAYGANWDLLRREEAAAWVLPPRGARRALDKRPCRDGTMGVGRPWIDGEVMSS